MPAFLQPYAKAVVAFVGIAALIALSKWGVSYPDLNAMILAIVRESLWGAVATFGVYQVTNRPTK